MRFGSERRRLRYDWMSAVETGEEVARLCRQEAAKRYVCRGSCLFHCSDALVQLRAVRSEKTTGINCIVLCDQKPTCAEFRQMRALFVYMRRWRKQWFRCVTIHHVFFENADFSNCRNRIWNSENPQNRFCVLAFRERFSMSAFARRNHLWFQGCEHRICVHTWNKIRSFWGNTQNPDFEKSAVESNRYHAAKKWFLRFCDWQNSNAVFEKPRFSEINTGSAKSCILEFLIYFFETFCRPCCRFVSVKIHVVLGGCEHRF